MEEDQMAMTQQARRRVAVLALAFGHLALAGLGLADRLEYTRPPQLAFLELVAGSQLWIPINIVVAVALLTTSSRHPLALSRALSASMAAMGAWSFFTLLWGAWPSAPVSLAGPVLGAVVAVGAHLLSRAYMEASMTHGEV